MQRAEAKAVRNIWNCRELSRKLTQREKARTSGKADAEGKSWNCQE